MPSVMRIVDQCAAAPYLCKSVLIEQGPVVRMLGHNLHCVGFPTIDQPVVGGMPRKCSARVGWRGVRAAVPATGKIAADREVEVDADDRTRVARVVSPVESDGQPRLTRVPGTKGR